MRSIVYVCSCVSFAAAAVACGGGYSTPIGDLLPKQLDASPGCFVEPAATATTGDSAATLQFVRAARSMQEFRLSFLTQQATLLSRPIAQEPDAEEWKIDDNPDFLVEGVVLARGERWAVVKMVLTSPRLNGPMSGTLELYGDRTIYELGRDVLELTPDYLRDGDFIRGCDPRTKVSFEVGPGISNGEFAASVHSCWRGGGEDDGANVGTDGTFTIPGRTPGQGEVGQSEFEASAHLQCLQLVQRVTLSPAFR
jgi:hypothetical protein